MTCLRKLPKCFSRCTKRHYPQNDSIRMRPVVYMHVSYTLNGNDKKNTAAYTFKMLLWQSWNKVFWYQTHSMSHFWILLSPRHLWGNASWTQSSQSQIWAVDSLWTLSEGVITLSGCLAWALFTGGISNHPAHVVIQHFSTSCVDDWKRNKGDFGLC